MVALGRVRFGGFARSGQEVRAAGVILMLPFAASLLFTGVLWSISGNWSPEARNSFLRLLGLVQLVLQVGAMFAAWWVMRNSQRGDSATRTPLPGLMRQLMKMSEAAQREKPTQSSQSETMRPNASNFPSVMNTRQAAAYLQVPEQTILDLITNGKLIAARINHRYTIARSVLDEYRKNQGSAH